jgi:chemotaxis signal transduction protein
MAVTSGASTTVSSDTGTPPVFVRYLPVAVHKQQFAIPLDRVIGVVESSKITPLPFSPPPFEGLVLAMGQVVPQINLAALFGLPSSDGGVVVLISDRGGSVGLRVDHVHAMVQVEWEQVVLSSPEQREDEPMIVGRYGEGTASCGVLSLDHLTSDSLAMTVADSGSVMLATEAAAGAAEDDETAEHQSEPYLVVDVSGESYAVKIDHLIELLELSTLRSVPQAPEWISGMIDLRGEPILGISLAALLNRPQGEAGKLGLMVAHPAGSVALIAEHSRGIERFAAEQIHPLREPMAGISSYLVRADDSIVAIIDPHSMLRPVDDDLHDWVPSTQVADHNAVPAKPMEYHQFLTLRVGREFIAVPLDRIQRLQASVQMTPIPDRGLGFDGLADVGDAIVPVIDLRRVLAEETDSTASDAAPPCLLAMIEGGVAGIIVNQVLRIETVPESQISPAEDTPNLPVSHVLHLQDRLMCVVSLDRLLPPL